MTLDEQLKKMAQDWDLRAKENARYYVNTERQDWTDEEFFRSGRRTVEEEIVLLTLYAKAKTDNLTGAKLKEIRRVLES